MRSGGIKALVAALCVLALVVAPAALSSSSQRHVALSSLEAGVLQRLNAIRAQHDLTPLRLSAPLTAAAAQHSREMGEDGYFEHNSFDGTVFWKRIGRWYSSSGYGSWTVGENLLWSSPGVDPRAALDLWMHSPEHRANILTPRWREIGVAAVHMSSAGGMYKGLPVTIITTDFGARG